MRYKKFLLIPVGFVLLVFLYVNFINSLAHLSETVRQNADTAKSVGGEAIGVGQAVSIQVTRATKPYLFGLVNLPAYAPAIGDLASLHMIFFWSLGILTILLTGILVIIERRNMNMVKIEAPRAVFKKTSIWMRVAKAVGVGALFAFVAFLISGDNSSLALGLLVAYLEFRLT